MLERLHKILATAGIASRRACEQIITEGRVRIDGEIVVEMGHKVDPQTSAITVDGKPLPHPKSAYYLLNKPAGYLCTADDPFGRKTVLDLMVGVRERVFPVGRLDEDAEGLLIMTNDGALANVLTHPRYGVRKTYTARVKGRMSHESMDMLRSGVYLPGGPAVAEELVVRRYKTGDALVRMVVREGRNHVVKKMLAAVGNPVKKLKRTNIEFLTLHRLTRGAWRPLTTREIELLRALAKKRTTIATETDDETRPAKKPKRRLLGAPKKRPGSRRDRAAKKSPKRPAKRKFSARPSSPASRKPATSPARPAKKKKPAALNNRNPRRTGERLDDTTRKSTTGKNYAGDGRSRGKGKRPAGGVARKDSKRRPRDTGKR